MTPNEKARRKFWALLIMLVLILGTIVLWTIAAWNEPDFSLVEGIAQGAILLLVLAFIIPLLVRMRRDIKRGLPTEDERSKDIKILAGYYSFMISLYIWLAIMFFEEHFTVSSAGGTAILGSAVTFGLAWVILSRRPNVR